MTAKMLLPLAAVFLLGAADPAKPVEISMKSLGYAPKILDISAGQAVVWKNTAHTDHSAVADTGAPQAFDTGMVAPGKASSSVVFAAPGVYKYHCGLHGSSMVGTIRVAPAR